MHRSDTPHDQSFRPVVLLLLLLLLLVSSNSFTENVSLHFCPLEQQRTLRPLRKPFFNVAQLHSLSRECAVFFREPIKPMFSSSFSNDCQITCPALVSGPPTRESYNKLVLLDFQKSPSPIKYGAIRDCAIIIRRGGLKN